MEDEDVVSLTPQGEHGESVKLQGLKTGTTVMKARYQNMEASCIIEVVEGEVSPEVTTGEI